MENLNNLPEEDDPAALRKALLQSRRNQADLRSLIENTGDGIWSMDLDFNVQVFNSAASLMAMKISGVPMEKGQNFLKLVSVKERNRWETAGRRIRGHEQFTQTHVMEWKGKIHRFEVSFSPIFDDVLLSGIAVFCKETAIPASAASAPIREGKVEVGGQLPLRSQIHSWVGGEGNTHVTQASAPVTAGMPAKGLNILVCEDNPINQLVIVKMLEGMGCGA